MKIKKIMVELDGVLSDNTHRLDYRGDYDHYQYLFEGDSVNEKLLEILSALSDTHEITVFTMMPERMRTEVESWLADNDVPCEELVMRPDTDYTKESDLRLEFVADAFAGSAECAGIIITNEKATEQLREQGYFVMQIGWS